MRHHVDELNELDTDMMPLWEFALFMAIGSVFLVAFVWAVLL